MVQGIYPMKCPICGKELTNVDKELKHIKYCKQSLDKRRKDKMRYQYLRRCKRCNKDYHTSAKHSKICLNCWKPKFECDKKVNIDTRE